MYLVGQARPVVKEAEQPSRVPGTVKRLGGLLPQPHMLLRYKPSQCTCMSFQLPSLLLLLETSQWREPTLGVEEEGKEQEEEVVVVEEEDRLSCGIARWKSMLNLPPTFEM